MTKRESVEEAVFEARRFIKRAEEWLKRTNNDSMAELGCKEGGAMRRSSMDLTRALVDVRKP